MKTTVEMTDSPDTQSLDDESSDRWLPLVYDELRKLARQRLANDQPGQTLQATALVHEAYLRVTGNREVDWENTGHFFAAAAEAMRRILIDRARRRKTEKHGGDRRRIDLEEAMPAASDDQLLLVHEALDDLQEYDSRKADVVKLRFFTGLTHQETAAALGISAKTAERDWIFAKAWLSNHIQSR